MKVSSVVTLIFALSFILASDRGIAKDIKIKAVPINIFQKSSPEQIKFGELEFISGLELTSKNDNFGGISGMRIVKNSLYAVTDKGHFLTAQIKREMGKLKALKKATLTRLRGRDGKRLKGKKKGDAESLEIIGSQYIIGFERNDRIEIFNLNDDRLLGDKRSKTVSLKKFKFPNNKGPEAIAHVPGTQKLLAFAEYAPTENNLHQAFMIENEEITPFFLTLTTGYSLTDAAFLPNNRLLMLERFYTPLTGPAMRLRTFNVDNIVTGSVLDGKIIMQVNSATEIDNMEGIAITQDEAGATRITLISDDNFARNQRTLLLEFKLTN